MISFYQAPYAQKGYGFGGIFRGLSKLISPIASGISKVVHNPTVQSIAKDAIRTGVSLTADAIEGRQMNAREESERLLKRARTKVAKKLREEIDDEEKDSNYRYKKFKNQSDSDTDSDNAYNVSKTPVFSKKAKLRGRLVKKKKRTIFDE
ncbi:hypothetical protein [Aeromonas sobria]|uniref:hypothetical protein n=1 Tax=Aeromonas sobria TaxID=646 RepID=UPI003F2A4585